MKKNLTEIVFILDRSGSMAGLEADTIGGFNAMIEKQKREPGEAYVSTLLFDNLTEVIHDRVNLREICPMSRKDYYVRGSTALLDAVGKAIHHIGNVHKYARPEDRPERTLFVITPDRAVTYQCDREGTALNYEVIGETVKNVRSGAVLEDTWKERIEHDHKTRGKRKR